MQRNCEEGRDLRMRCARCALKVVGSESYDNSLNTASNGKTDLRTRTNTDTHVFTKKSIGSIAVSGVHYRSCAMQRREGDGSDSAELNKQRGSLRTRCV